MRWYFFAVVRFPAIFFLGIFLSQISAGTPEGLPGTYASPSAQTLDHGAISVGVTAFGNDDASQVLPRYLLLTPGGPDTASFQDLLSGGLILHAAMGLGGNFDFGLALPIYMNNIADPPEASVLNATALGDLKLLAKVRAPLPTPVLALSLAGGLTVPSNAGQGFLPMVSALAVDTAGRGFNHDTYSAKALTEMGLGIITVDLSQARFSLPFRFNVSGGYWHLPRGLGGDRALWNGSLEWLASPRLGFFGDLSSQASLSGFNGVRSFIRQDLRTTAGISLNGDDGFSASGGAQFTLSDRPLFPYQKSVPGGGVATYSARALPDVSVVVQVSWTGSLFPKDSDGDGIPDDQDKCPTVPGLLQFAGCPNPDSDKDGICDPWVAQAGLSARFANVCTGVDKCPNDPEDKDGFQDEDGCPEPDNDKDGICDPWVAASGQSAKYAAVCKGSDKCPNDPEDFDGFEDQDGCPDLDNDKDGILDSRDKCPNDAEDKDGFEDQDGCPDPDNDKDGVCDPWVATSGQSAKYADVCHGSDKCPDQSGPVDNTGCPVAKSDSDTTAARAPFPDHIALPQVHFQGETKALTVDSYLELDTLLHMLKVRPDVHLEIHVYSDDRGRASRLLELTQARAETIRRYLILHGIDRLHLTAVGMGSKNPIASNHTARGRRENRRVEVVRSDERD